MPSAAWTRLLRLIPPQDQDNLMLLTSNRTEIAIQSVLRLDPDFLVIKGRLAGSQEAGRIFFVPYEQIDHIGFYRSFKDAEFNEKFAGLDAPPPEAEAAPAEAAAAESNGAKTPLIKSAVLERFRSRSTTIMMPSPLAPRGPSSSPALPPNGQPAEAE